MKKQGTRKEIKTAFALIRTLAALPPEAYIGQTPHGAYRILGCETGYDAIYVSMIALAEARKAKDVSKRRDRNSYRLTLEGKRKAETEVDGRGRPHKAKTCRKCSSKRRACRCGVIYCPMCDGGDACHFCTEGDAAYRALAPMLVTGRRAKPARSLYSRGGWPND